METKDLLIVVVLAAVCYYVYNLQKRILDLEGTTAALPNLSTSVSNLINYADTYSDGKTL